MDIERESGAFLADKMGVSPQKLGAEMGDLQRRMGELETECERLNEALQASEVNSRMIVDSIPGLVAMLTPAGEVEMVNRPLLEYFGQTLEELRHWGTNGTVFPDDLPHVMQVFSRSIASGTPY